MAVAQFFQQADHLVPTSTKERCLFLKLEEYCSETSEHSIRVGQLSMGIAKNLGFSLQEQEMMYRAGLLHDVGKLAITKGILSKPGPLHLDEWKIVRSHPLKGAEILAAHHLRESVLEDVTLYHHERLDGSGYPYGLDQQETPFSAQIAAVADSWDAMTRTRSYKNSVHPVDALIELQGLKSKYNPIIVSSLMNYLECVL